MNHNYCKYKINRGDTLYNIAKKFKTTTQAILSANQFLNPFLLKDGMEIIIPLRKEIVVIEPYTYENFYKNILDLNLIYPFISINTIGKSLQKRDIIAITFGEGSQCVLYNAGHHGNEWITSLLLMKWLEKIAFTYSLKGRIMGYDIPKLFRDYKVVLVPMVNPDGVNLAIHGIDSVSNNQNTILKMNGRNLNFVNWKANSRGVDLNRNYAAQWQEYKGIEKRLGIKGPCAAGFSGSYPESEPEVSALTEFTRNIAPKFALSFHSQGQVIYWNYNNIRKRDCYNMAKALSQVSGYALGNEDFSASFAGYKDWFLKEFNRPALTIEVGLGKNPLSLKQFSSIYERNEELLLLSAMF